MHMDVREVPIESIDVEDTTFRISENLDPSALEDSLRAVGQINPVILCVRPEAAPQVVCGFRRLRALRRIGKTSCHARFLPPGLRNPLSSFRIALWDNVAHRPLEALEKARALSTLKHGCAVREDELVETYLPILGLEKHKNVLRTYLGLHLLDPHLRTLLTSGELTVAAAERLSAMSPGVQAAVAGLLTRARLSASLQRQFLDLVTDLSAIRECQPDELLSHSEIRAVLDDAALSPFQRGEAVFRILYRQRNPRLTSAEDRFESGKSRLGLPGFVRLSPDPFFESPRIRVEFEASSAECFREAGESLQRAAQEPALADLFRVR